MIGCAEDIYIYICADHFLVEIIASIAASSSCATVLQPSNLQCDTAFTTFDRLCGNQPVKLRCD